MALTFPSWTLTLPDDNQITSSTASFTLAPTYIGTHSLAFRISNFYGIASASSSITVPQRFRRRLS